MPENVSRGEESTGIIGRSLRLFHLEINTIEDFAVLCALIRGETLDPKRVQTIITQLHSASQDLSAAEAAEFRVQPGLLATTVASANPLMS